MVIFVRGNATCSMHDTKIFKRPPVRGGVGLPGSASPFFMHRRQSSLRCEITHRFARQQPPRRVAATSGRRRVEHQVDTLWLQGLLQAQPPQFLIFAVVFDFRPVDILKGPVLVEVRTIIQIMTRHALVACFGKWQFHRIPQLHFYFIGDSRSLGLSGCVTCARPMTVLTSIPGPVRRFIK